MLVNEVLKCEAPDCEADVKIEKNTQGVYCSKCDTWLIATTYLPQILIDTEEYRVVLFGGDFKNVDHVKAVASVASVNFLQSRKFLLAGEVEVFLGSAKNVENAASILARAGVDYRIEPDFPYVIDDKGLSSS